MFRCLAGLCCAILLLAGCTEDPGGAGRQTEAPAFVEPSVEPTPDPTATPVPAPTPLPLPIKLLDGAGTVAQNSTASLTIRTKAKSKCSIAVIYDTVVSEAKGLSDKTANSKGEVAWKWRVGSNTYPGKWPISVSCVLAARTGKLATSITVK